MKRLIAFLILVLWSISMTASASASMSVLCVEQDGQRLIEFSMDSHCYDAFKAAAMQAKSLKAGVHGTDCVDTPLVSSATACSPEAVKKSVLANVGSYVIAFLTSTTAATDQYNRIARTPFEHLAIRSAYVGQRETIVIQQ